MGVNWSDRAQSDIQRIRDWYPSTVTDEAEIRSIRARQELYAKAIIAVGNTLDTFPRSRPSKTDGTREKIVKDKYVIVYDISSELNPPEYPEHVIIVSIWSTGEERFNKPRR
jgi:plasmid stabilization system protein ParE